MDIIDWLVPQESVDDARMRTRFRGIAKSLLTISLVVLVMWIGIALVRGRLVWQEHLLFLGCIGMPMLGALLIRATANISLGLLVTNLGGIVIVTAWAWLSGGVLSIALPAFLANISLLGTFGNVSILLAMGAVQALALLLLYAATVFDWLPPSVAAASDLPGLMLTAMLGSTAIVVLAGYFLARDRALVKTRLNEARRAAEQSSRAKAVFLHSMSQEFRAPLDAVLGQAEAVAASLPADDPRQRDLQGIATAGQYLGDLLDQLLEMSRIEAAETTPRIEPVAVAQIVEPCLAIIRAEAERCGVALSDDCGESGQRRVWGDRVLLRQVVLNLLTNAVRFNRPRGTVSVSCELLAENFLRIVVADSGTGIPRARQRELFEPLSALGLEQGSVAGASLGLVRSKQLVERMRGRIAFDSIEGMGSRFWVDLPLAD
jgi:signal transduction histidine kinase